MAIVITIPAQHTTAAARYAYLEKLQNETMIILYNRMSVWHNTGGVTLTQYNNLLPRIVKNLFAYVPKLSDADFTRFERLYERVYIHINHLKSLENDAIKTDVGIAVDINAEVDEV